jgi:hypothetical protein
MNANRFESILRSLSRSSSRRGALGLLAGLVLGRPHTFGSAEIAAHDAMKKCKKIDAKDKKKKCVKRAKQHNATHRTAVPPPAPTCTDGVKNGAETGIDCGGACPRCANGQGCATRNDCATSFCDAGTCASCTVSTICGADAYGDCRCYPTTGGTFCGRGSPTGPAYTSCDACPADTLCNSDGPPFDCYKLCGAA